MKTPEEMTRRHDEIMKSYADLGRRCDVVIASYDRMNRRATVLNCVMGVAVVVFTLALIALNVARFWPSLLR